MENTTPDFYRDTIYDVVSESVVGGEDTLAHLNLSHLFCETFYPSEVHNAEGQDIQQGAGIA